MSDAQFKKRIEDFVCEYCGEENSGNGFTNHCKQCLWSKHVDVNPGDRASLCGGMMKPVSVEGIVGKYDIVHVCERCGYSKRNKVASVDSFETVIAIAGKDDRRSR